MRKTRTWLPLLAVLVLMVTALTTGAFAAGEEAAEYVSPFYATPFALLPPVVAIGLALITKEVYSSLFIGILVGGLISYQEVGFTTAFGGTFLFNAASVALGELLACYVLGLPLLALMDKAKVFGENTPSLHS